MPPRPVERVRFGLGFRCLEPRLRTELAAGCLWRATDSDKKHSLRIVKIATVRGLQHSSFRWQPHGSRDPSTSSGERQRLSQVVNDLVEIFLQSKRRLDVEPIRHRLPFLSCGNGPRPRAQVNGEQTATFLVSRVHIINHRVGHF